MDGTVGTFGLVPTLIALSSFGALSSASPSLTDRTTLGNTVVGFKVRV